MTADTPPPPRKNPDLAGHERAEAEILAALRAGRLHHGWLIAGPRGIGKATLAYRVARFVLAGAPATDARSLRVPPDAPVFRRIAAGGHSDLLSLERRTDPKTGKLRREIVVGDVRAVGPFLGLTAGEGGWRVVVVDAADDMNRNAANALLKLLEEPPRNSLFLLVAHAPGRLPATIRSRCRRLDLHPLEDDALDGFLAGAVPDLTAADRRTLTRLAEGSPGRALELHAAGGPALFADLLRLIGAYPGTDVVGLHALADGLGRAEGEPTFRALADLLRWWLARLVRAGASGALPAPAAAGETELIQRLLGARALADWLEVWEKTSHLLSRGEALDLDRRQILLNCFTDLAAAGSAR